MDTAMRDLERIEETSPHGDGNFRRAGAFVVALGATLVLLYGMAELLAPRNEAPEAVDPLAALAPSEELAQEIASAEQEQRPSIEIDRTSLRFPETLVADERPEVAATLANAAAEEAMLGVLHQPSALQPAPLAAPSTTPVAHPVAALPLAAMPASHLAAGDSRELARALPRDPMAAQALPEPERAPEPGRVGSDGRYTLQVISYRTPDEAELFARVLRDKGHDAFVMEAEVEGRGRFYRVRIGPFEQRGVAERYRRQFESDEGMATIVVRRREEA